MSRNSETKNTVFPKVKMAADFLQRVDLSEEKMTVGVDANIGNYTVKVAYYGQANPNYIKQATALASKLQSTDKDVAHKAHLEMFATVSILEWDLKDDEGKPTPCDLEHKMWLLETYPHFHEMLVNVAADYRNYSNIDASSVLGN